MQNKKDKLFGKIVKKDYENELEQVLEEKNFEEDVKNILLGILYKIGNSYKDYQEVKRNAETKDEYIQSIINTLKNTSFNMRLVKPEDKIKKLDGKDFFIENDEIITYPVERKILYAIFLANKQNDIVKDKYFLADKALSEAINIGEAIEKVEPLRDFNGWSWTTLTEELGSVECNLMFQNLRLLIDRQFLNEWIYKNEYLNDYLELLQSKFGLIYGEKTSKKFIEQLKNVAILVQLRNDKKKQKELTKMYNSLSKQLDKFKDTKKLINFVSKNKKSITNKIEEIDKILNNKLLLEEEYKKRNEKLKLEEKIFSERLLTQQLQEERNELLNEFEQNNELLNPNIYMKRKKEIEDKINVLEIVQYEDIEEALIYEVMELQKVFLDMFFVKVENAQTKTELVDLIYMFRYYCMLPYKGHIFNIKNLKSRVNKVCALIIERALDNKIWVKVSNDESLNLKVLKEIFNTRIITLENIYLDFYFENDKVFLNIMDEKNVEKTIEIKSKDKLSSNDFAIKFNKGIKLFY